MSSHCFSLIKLEHYKRVLFVQRQGSELLGRCRGRQEEEEAAGTRTANYLARGPTLLLSLSSSRYHKTSKRLHPSQSDPRNQIEFKRGYLMRKCVYESDGAPSESLRLRRRGSSNTDSPAIVPYSLSNTFSAAPLGRRGWKMYFVRLKALALYFSRDESDPPLYNTLSCQFAFSKFFLERL